MSHKEEANQAARRLSVSSDFSFRSQAWKTNYRCNEPAQREKPSMMWMSEVVKAIVAEEEDP